MHSLTKLFRASPDAKSRFHDLQGHITPPRRLAINLPRAIWSRLLLDIAKRQPRRPWISYDAAARIERLMKRRPCKVLEFGSGNSTLWFATHATELHSVEHNPEWYNRVHNLLKKSSRKAKLMYELRETMNEYSTFRSNNNEIYDIILIDGIWRLPVTRHHIEKLAADGILYLDNSDANSSSEHVNEIPELLKFLDEWKLCTGRKMEIFTDFSPTALHATQGRMYFNPAGSE